MTQVTLLKSAGLFILTYLALLGISLYFGNAYVQTLLPLYRWELNHLAQDYQLQSLVIGENHGEQVISLTLLTKYFVISQHEIPSGISISCSTLVGYALQHLLLIFSLVVAWPTPTLKQKFIQIFCALPFLLLVELLDIPFMLLGSAQDLMAANFASSESSLAIEWMNFMNGGGRQALSLFAAMLAVIGSRYCHSTFKPQAG
jgi:hypothetical protein